MGNHSGRLKQHGARAFCNERWPRELTALHSSASCNVNMQLSVGCAHCLCSLSLWERAGVRVPRCRKKPLTLTLSRGEREQKGPVKINVTVYS